MGLTFTFGDTTAPHIVGDKNCIECNELGEGDPVPCKCGGLIHSAFGDEASGGDFWYYYSCDKCGENYENKNE